MTITISHDGDTWRILSEGSVRDGKVYCHLTSTTRGNHQRSGFVPLQICDWIDQRVILSHAIQAEEAQRKAQYSDIVSDGGMDPRDRAITDYYTDRAAGAHANRAR